MGDFVFTIVGALLITASGMKVHAVANQPLSLEMGSLAIAVFESTLGLLMVFRIRFPWVRTVAVGTFTIFAMVTAFKLARGESECGCFGDASVHPGVMFFLDISIILGLLTTRLSEVKRKALDFCVVILVLLLSLASVRLLESQKELLNTDTSKWIGKRLPTDVLGDGDVLLQGDWVVVLYRPGCKACGHAISNIRKLNRDSLVGLALIEVPPFSSRNGEIEEGIVHLRLTNSRRWTFSTPLILKLSKGAIMSVSKKGDIMGQSSSLLSRPQN